MVTPLPLKKVVQKGEKSEHLKVQKMYFHVFESFYLLKVVFDIGIESGVIFHAIWNFSGFRGAPESSGEAKLRFDMFLNFGEKNGG